MILCNYSSVAIVAALLARSSTCWHLYTRTVLTCHWLRARCHWVHLAWAECLFCVVVCCWPSDGRTAAHTWASSRTAVDMDDFWAGALWALKIWLYLIISLIMVPAMFGFSLGISETYMTVLVKTLEVQWGWLLLFVCLFDVVFVVLPGEAAVRHKCAPLLQWATLKMQKAKADEQLFKMSSSNGEYNEKRRSIVTDGGFDNHLIAQHLISSHMVLHVSTCCGRIFRSSRSHWCSCVFFNHSRVPLSLTLSTLCPHLSLSDSVVAQVISQLLKSLCHTGCFSLSSYTIKMDCVSKTESLLSPKCARVSFWEERPTRPGFRCDLLAQICFHDFCRCMFPQGYQMNP